MTDQASEPTSNVAVIEHLGHELQVQLVREGEKDYLAIQDLAGGVGRRIEADSAEALALARHSEVAQLLGIAATAPPEA